MDLNTLTVYESPYPKHRIGKNNDGGYVIANVPDVSYKLCLAGGVCDDISFEEAFCEMYPGSICYAFDGTLSSPPTIKHPNVRFIRQNVGPRNSFECTNLHDLLETNKDILVKMDIEGHEIPWFLSLDSTHIDNIVQMVVEFHFPFSLLETIVFDKINRTHVLIHFHANNNCGTRMMGSVVMPNVFECTYLHKRFFERKPTLNHHPIPSELDMPNVVTKDEIHLIGPPFVHPRNH